MKKRAAWRIPRHKVHEIQGIAIRRSCSVSRLRRRLGRPVAHAIGERASRTGAARRLRDAVGGGKDHRLEPRKIGLEGDGADIDHRRDHHIDRPAKAILHGIGRLSCGMFRANENQAWGVRCQILCPLYDWMWSVTCGKGLGQQGHSMAGTRIFLGIESSCDDTAAAVVSMQAGRGRVLSSVVAGQTGLHAEFGGVVPEIAARAHTAKLDDVVRKALGEAGTRLQGIDGIAVTAGPGLIGGLLSGVLFARGLAAGSGCPVHPVNHLAGHALTPRLTDGLSFPYLLLLVSGGHCQILMVRGPAAFQRLGGTIDDAPGEAFDKVARALGLPQPGGPAIEAEAEGGDPARFALPRPLLDRPGCDMSFSGLKTAVLRERDRLVAAQGGLYRQDRRDLCAGFQAAVVEVLTEKTRRALAIGSVTALAAAGGVAANTAIRAGLETVSAEVGIPFTAPPMALCTDNAAMIAWAGLEQEAAGATPMLEVAARPRWPLDTVSPSMIGGGRKGAKA